MKREPRGESGDNDRDDDTGEPPPDPGMGGKSLSPEELSKTERRGKGVQLANDAIGILQRIPIDDPLRKIGMETVEKWIKANK
jgi:hypothetical protein